MVRHIILWKLKDGFSNDEKAAVKAGIKSGLEGLKGVVPGLENVLVRTEGLASSTADLMLDAVFTDADALKNYSGHPAHVAVANAKVRPFVQTRLCLDFEE